MTSDPTSSGRRSLGAGPQTPDEARRLRAAEADLAGLPSIRYPDLDELRTRGVLEPGTRPAVVEPSRRRLGNGPAADTGLDAHEETRQ
ncbi:hypothetical protein [Streptomyces achromogenes]|uniref:hypothetical protein n=1 Tax=Streptomyces achromogenes TaxID=67255 RepID=UPI0034367A3F